MFARPRNLENLRRQPPINEYDMANAPKPELPEKKLYMSLLKKWPELKKPLLSVLPSNSLPQRFAQAQWRYMKEQRLSEQEAFLLCEKDFRAEFEQLHRVLRRMTADPYKSMAQHIIRNVTRFDLDAKNTLLRKRTPRDGRMAKHKSATVDDMLGIVLPQKEAATITQKTSRWNNRFFAERDHFLGRKPVTGVTDNKK